MNRIDGFGFEQNWELPDNGDSTQRVLKRIFTQIASCLNENKDAGSVEVQCLIDEKFKFLQQKLGWDFNNYRDYSVHYTIDGHSYSEELVEIDPRLPGYMGQAIGLFLAANRQDENHPNLTARVDSCVKKRKFVKKTPNPGNLRTQIPQDKDSIQLSKVLRKIKRLKKSPREFTPEVMNLVTENLNLLNKMSRLLLRSCQGCAGIEGGQTLYFYVRSAMRKLEPQESKIIRNVKVPNTAPQNPPVEIPPAAVVPMSKNDLFRGIAHLILSNHLPSSLEVQSLVQNYHKTNGGQFTKNEYEEFRMLCNFPHLQEILVGGKPDPQFGSKVWQTIAHFIDQQFPR